MKPIPTWSDGVRPEYRSVVQIAAPLMQQEIDALRKRVQELEADAKRYRWLRDQSKVELHSDGSRWTKNGVKFIASHRLCTGYTAHGHFATLDETIDSAMGLRGGNGEAEQPGVATAPSEVYEAELPHPIDAAFVRWAHNHIDTKLYEGMRPDRY